MTMTIYILHKMYTCQGNTVRPRNTFYNNLINMQKGKELCLLVRQVSNTNIGPYVPFVLFLQGVL